MVKTKSRRKGSGEGSAVRLCPSMMQPSSEDMVQDRDIHKRHYGLLSTEDRVPSWRSERNPLEAITPSSTNDRVGERTGRTLL